MECRNQFVNGVMSLLAYLDEMIPDPLQKTQRNMLHGNGCNIYKGDSRTRRPWLFLDHVAEGRSGPVGFAAPGSRLRSCSQYAEDWIDTNQEAFQ